MLELSAARHRAACSECNSVADCLQFIHCLIINMSDLESAVTPNKDFL